VHKTSLLTIVAVLWLAGGLNQLVAQAPIAGVYREVYTNITGVNVSDLTNSAKFPNSPDQTGYLTNSFEAPTDIMDNYGQRCRALVTAPTTGNYLFWISSDYASTLYLSPDESPNNKVAIASVATWTASREWTKEANQQSAPTALSAGQRYYIEALMKEGGGGDNLAVRWQLPDGTIEEPLAASRMTPFTGAPTSPPVITSQPTNTTTVEGNGITFRVVCNNFDPLSYQWQRNSNNIPAAISSTYTITNTALTNSGVFFRCVITNSLGVTTSSNALLTVNPDTTPPAITLVQNLGSNQVTVTFSEALEASSATNRFNYSISNAVSVSAAVFGNDTRQIILTTSPLIFGNNYTLYISNVRDRAATPNTIAPNSAYTFVATEYTPQDIGSPAQAGSTTRVTNGYDVTAGGSDVGGSTDQFHFDYQQRAGDFDVSVRVQGLTLSDAWAKAGLMARETLNVNSRFAASFATPNLSGCFFEYRDPAAGNAVSVGSFPANGINTWLRLQRAGNQFSGYASADGQTWTQLGSATIAMSNSVYFGMAVSSHSTNQMTTALFRDLTNTTGAVIGTLATGTEPLGPSSRKTSIVISEIMYKPAARADGKNLEYLELFNSNPFPENISGYRISGDTDFTFPAGTVVAGGGFLVVAKVPGDVAAAYGITNVLGPYSNPLGKSSTVQLRNNTDAIYLEVTYDNKLPWPVGADGTGHSLVLARPSYGEADPRAWTISDVTGGSPGAMETFRAAPQRSVVINEFLAHTDPGSGLVDYIELYNHGTQTVDISGCYLSDDPATNKFRIPQGTVVPPRGFVWFDETQLGFGLSASGESIFFVDSNQTRVLDAVSFEAQANGISTGRYPDGANDFYPMLTRTPGTNNSAILIPDVAINEIMYAPISGDDEDTYVELYNKGTNAVNLTGWKFVHGISFDFPNSTILAPGGYLVVANNLTNLTAHYAGLNSNNTVGNFSGKLSKSGDRLALTMPQNVVSTNSTGTLKTNRIDVIVDEVTYGTGGRWGHWAKEGGSSLELLDPRGNHRLAGNWGDSDETAKAPWTTIQNTGVLDLGATYAGTAIDRLEIMITGEGECLLDNVQVINQSGVNVLSNTNFESGLSPWTPQGDHVQSFLGNSGGFGGGKCLHIKSTDRGDTGANRIRVALSSALTAGQTATIRAQVRWLRGWPEIVLRLKGNYLEAAGSMLIPSNLGTPGARNSRAVANTGPAIYDVIHNPILPQASQPVVVTARVHDPDGIASFVLKYRVDPASTYTTVTMLDNGTGGDMVAGDGIFSATIPGQSSGVLAAFYIQASDNFSPSATTLFPNNAPAG